MNLTPPNPNEPLSQLLIGKVMAVRALGEPVETILLYYEGGRHIVISTVEGPLLFREEKIAQA